RCGGRGALRARRAQDDRADEYVRCDLGNRTGPRRDGHGLFRRRRRSTAVGRARVAQRAHARVTAGVVLNPAEPHRAKHHETHHETAGPISLPRGRSHARRRCWLPRHFTGLSGMTIRLIPWLIAIGTACTGLAAHAAGTAHSLDEVPGKFSSPDARAAYARDMSGVPEQDGFGVHLPPGFTKEALVAQLAPGQPLGRVVLVGAKPWPQRPGAFVAIVCAAPTDDLAREVLQFRAPTDCEGYERHPDADETKELVWLGVFERGPDGEPRLVARTEQPLDQGIDWSQTNIESPDSFRKTDDFAIRPQRWLRFDLAPYALRAGDAAFGVRAGWSIGYAG
ncbi:hypothetical protein MTR_1279s0010, partial [Medicago truncatula]